MPAAERLATMEKYRATVEKYAPCILRLACTYNAVGRCAEAHGILTTRRFHVWEGADGLLAPFVESCIGLGKEAMAKNLNSQAGQIREKIGQLEVHKRAIEERIESLTEEIDEQEADLHEKTKQLEDVRKNIESFKENIDTAATQITENADKIDGSEDEIENLNDRRVGYQKQLESITEDIVTELDAKLKDYGFSSSASRKAKEELEAAGKAIHLLGGDLIREDSFLLPGSDLSRTLIEIGKKEHTLEKYPRKAPLPSKMPL